MASRHTISGLIGNKASSGVVIPVGGVSHGIIWALVIDRSKFWKKKTDPSSQIQEALFQGVLGWTLKCLGHYI